MNFHRYLLVCLGLLILTSHAQASQAQTLAFLQSENFDQICEKTVIKQKNKQGNYYHLTRQVFAESDDSLFVIVKEKMGQQLLSRLLKVSKMDSSEMEEIYFSESFIRDLIYKNNHVWFLHSDRLGQINLQDGQVTLLDLPNAGTGKKNDRAYDMGWVNGKIVVANGLKGLAIVSPENMKLMGEKKLGLMQPNGHKSVAVSIAKSGKDKVFVGISNITLPTQNSLPMNGIMETGVGNFDRPRYYPYDRQQAGILSRVVKMKVYGEMLWINNWGTLQFSDIKQIRKKRKVEIGYIPLNATFDGEDWSQEILGEFQIMNNRVYACAKASPMTQPKLGKRGRALRFDL